LLPKLGMSAIELGRFIAKSPEPHRDVAELFIKKGITKKSLSDVVESLRPQVHNKPSLNRIGSANMTVTRMPRYTKEKIAYVAAPIVAIAGVWAFCKYARNPVEKLF